MIYREHEPKRPEVLGVRTVGWALVFHIAFFLLFWLAAQLTFRSKETVIPIDLTVVVNENLDGEENDPPPLNDPPPPPPHPEPKPEVPPPPLVQRVNVDALEQQVEKEEPKKEKPKEPEKPKPEKPKPPQKTAEQLRRERLARMRERATVVKAPVRITVKDALSGNGRTAQQTLSPEEIRALLNRGYRPGTTTQLAASEEQRCLSLIKAAFYSKWNRPPWTDTLRKMHLEVRFGAGGRVMGFRLVQGSGNAQADATVRQAAQLVSVVHGLSSDFLEKNKTVTIRFEVKPE